MSAKTDVLSTAVGPASGDASRDGGLATSFEAQMSGIVVDRAGNLLLSAPGHLWVAARSTGTFYGRAMVKGRIYAVAKLAKGTSAQAVDSRGNLVLADRLANKILVLALRSGRFYGRTMVAGRTYPVAGTGAEGKTGDGGPALKARLDWPTGVAVDHHGNLVIADTINSRIRVVAVRSGRFYGQPMHAGDIYTVVDQTGAWWNGGFAGDGGPAIKAKISRPVGVSFDQSGDMLIADTGNERVRMVAARSGKFYGQAMVAGHIYTLAGDKKHGFPVSGKLATRTPVFPEAVMADGSGNLVIGDIREALVVAARTGMFYGQRMTLGHLYVVAGTTVDSSRLAQDGWLAGRVQLGDEQGITVDGNGSIIMADGVRNEVSIVAGRTGTFYGRPMTAGHFYLITGAGNGTAPVTGGQALTAGLDPDGVAVDQAGNLIVTDLFGDRIWAIANSSGTFYGQPMTAGDIYVIAGGGSGASGSGDGGPATQAAFRIPEQLAIDGAGNVIFADTGDDRVRLVAVSTGSFYGQQMTAGDIYTIAGTGTDGSSPDGTIATKASLGGAHGVALDSAGNLLLTDDDVVRLVPTQAGTYFGRSMLAGHIYTIAGGGTGGLGDGGPASKATLEIELNIAVDPHGNLVIPGGLRVRVVAALDGTFYGVAMTAGHIYTVAGTGVGGFSGDGPATARTLEDPESVTFDAAGDLVIGDGSRIRSVTR